jgi:hypothetical protein
MADVVYAWVRVGDGNPEPAAIEGEKPNRKATTIGCPDTFNVDDPESGCAIVMVVNENYARVGNSYDDQRYGRAHEAIFRGPTEGHGAPVEVEPEEAARREAAYQQAIKYVPHSYAGFGRR